MYPYVIFKVNDHITIIIINNNFPTTIAKTRWSRGRAFDC